MRLFLLHNIVYTTMRSYGSSKNNVSVSAGEKHGHIANVYYKTVTDHSHLVSNTSDHLMNCSL